LINVGLTQRTTEDFSITRPNIHGFLAIKKLNLFWLDLHRQKKHFLSSPWLEIQFFFYQSLRIIYILRANILWRIFWYIFQNFRVTWVGFVNLANHFYFACCSCISQKNKVLIFRMLEEMFSYRLSSHIFKLRICIWKYVLIKQ